MLTIGDRFPAWRLQGVLGPSEPCPCNWTRGGAAHDPVALLAGG